LLTQPLGSPTNAPLFAAGRFEDYEFCGKIVIVDETLSAFCLQIPWWVVLETLACALPLLITAIIAYYVLDKVHFKLKRVDL
jgi:hypothetical protein